MPLILDVMYDNFLLFTDTYQKQIYQMDFASGAFHAVPLSAHNNPIAVDYDSLENRVRMKCLVTLNDFYSNFDKNMND